MSKKCYWITGNEMPPGFQPCNPAADNSPCCMLGKANPDICMSSGVCYSQTDDYEGYMYINGCTDKTGKAKECPQMCNPPSHTGANSLDVLECGRGVYCCRDFGTTGNCCTDSGALLTTGLGKMQLAAKTVTLSSGGGTAAATASAGAAPSAAATSGLDGDSAECPKSNAAVIGGAVGGTLGAALLASLAALALLYKRRSRGYKNPNAAAGAAPGAGSYDDHKVQSPGQYSYGSPATQHPATELPPQQPVHEMGH